MPTLAGEAVIPHVFQADPDLPADHRGRRVCAVCHLVGRTGDAHHDVEAG
jgi:hypothetical protein